MRLSFEPILNIFVISYLFISLLTGGWLEFFPALLVMLAIVAFPLVIFFAFMLFIFLLGTLFRFSFGSIIFLQKNPFKMYKFNYVSRGSPNHYDEKNTIDHKSDEKTVATSSNFKEKEKFGNYKGVVWH